MTTFEETPVPYLTTFQYAEAVHVSAETIRRWVLKNKIHPDLITASGRWLFLPPHPVAQAETIKTIQADVIVGASSSPERWARVLEVARKSLLMKGCHNIVVTIGPIDEEANQRLIHVTGEQGEGARFLLHEWGQSGNVISELIERLNDATLSEPAAPESPAAAPE